MIGVGGTISYVVGGGVVVGGCSVGCCSVGCCGVGGCGVGGLLASNGATCGAAEVGIGIIDCAETCGWFIVWGVFALVVTVEAGTVYYSVPY